MTSGFRIKDGARVVLMTCTECGRTRSLPVPVHHIGVEQAIAATGFAARKIALEAAGTCHECQVPDPS